MNRYLRLAIVAALALATILSAASCSRKQKIAAPKQLADSTIVRVKELTSQGYELLEKKDVTGAIAKFDEAGKLVPGGMYDAYHTACAYGRTGNKDEAFRALDRLVGNGFDYVESLLGDPDFETLQDDPRMNDLVARARTNFEKGTATLAAGLPEYKSPPDTFTTVERLNAWRQEQEGLIWKQSDFWTMSNTVSARADISGRYLADLRGIKAKDPEFDYGLERVRAAFRLQSPYSPGWAGVSDLVKTEANAYAKNSPAGKSAGEVDYLAGTALSLKYAKDDPRRVEGFTQAEAYFSKIPEGNEYYGAAQAMTAVNKYESPGSSKAEFDTAVRSIVERFPGDNAVRRVLATRLENGAAASLWPLALDVKDVGGKLVSLSEYRGKILMIDFWATWCGPCRRELPGLVEAYKKYHPQGLEIVSISLDYPNRLTERAYRDTIATLGMSWRHVYDGGAWDTELVKRFFIGSIPAAFLVNRDGSLAAWGEDLRGRKLEGTIAKTLAASS